MDLLNRKEKTMRLHFDAALVRRLLDHSKAAPTRKPTMEQLFDGQYRKDGQDVDLDTLAVGSWPTAVDVDPSKLPPGLWLVGDRGVYLMSNGSPALLVDPTKTVNVVAFAAEADPAKRPDSWWEIKRAAFGGDDGVTFLDLAFAETLVRAGRNGLVCIDLTPDTATVATPLR
jgi:hypothetical protein